MSRAVAFEDVGDLGHQGIIRVGVGQQGTDGEQEIQLASSFSLVVKNPCIDPTYVTIDDYNLYDE